MKTFIKVLYAILIFNVIPAQGQVFWEDNFEGTAPNMGGGTRSAPNHTNTTDGSSTTICGSNDYFFRTDCNTTGSAGQNCSGISETFANASGFMWRGEDLDGCITDPDIINFTGINISGKTGLTFNGLFACDGASNEWEGIGALDGHPDYLLVSYQIDGGGYVEGMIFRSDASANGTFGDNRGLFRVDTDNDGFGDGDVAMGETFQEFNFSIPGTGTTLDLQFEAFVNGSGEEFAIDNFQLEEMEVLPVTLTFFAAKPSNKDVLLEWQTAAEDNNDYFSIERSNNGLDFDSINEIKGNGTTENTSNYSFLDAAPKTGINYYRLKQVDYDGAYEYSAIVKVIFGDRGNTTVSPNPFQNFINLSFAERQENSTYQIYDLHGRLVQQGLLSTEDTYQELNVSQLQTGAYFLHIIADHNISKHRIIKN